MSQKVIHPREKKGIKVSGSHYPLVNPGILSPVDSGYIGMKTKKLPSGVPSHKVKKPQSRRAQGKALSSKTYGKQTDSA